MAEWTQIAQLVMSAGAIGYVALDRWAHRAEVTKPSLKVEIDQNKRDVEARLARIEYDVDQRARYIEELRLERQRQVDAELARIREWMNIVNGHTAQISHDLTDLMERLARMEAMFDGIRALVERRMAHRPHGQGERRSEGSDG